MPPGTDTAEWLERYGPWALVVLLIGAIIVLWNRNNKLVEVHAVQLAALNKEHAERLATIAKEHKVEMTVLLDRLITSSNGQVDKFKELAEQNARVIESLTRKVKPQRGGEGS